MLIDLPDDLVTEIVMLARDAQRGDKDESPGRLIEAVVRRGLPAWRSQHPAAVPWTRTVRPAGARILVERRWAELRRKLEDGCPLSGDELRVTQIPSRLCLFSPEDLTEPPLVPLRPREVLRAMTLVDVYVTYRFHVGGHFSFARDQRFAGFGGARQVRLIAGLDKRAPSFRQIAAIEVDVALPRGRWLEPEPDFGGEFPNNVIWLGREEAENAANHVVAVLRSRGVPIRRYGSKPDDPVSFEARVTRKFRDGSRIVAPSYSLSGSVVSVSGVGRSLGRPLSLPLQCFADAWHNGRNEVAQFFGGDSLGGFDAARRQLLVVESEVMGFRIDGSRPSPGEFTQCLEGSPGHSLLNEAEASLPNLALQRKQAGLTGAQVLSLLVDLRHRVSHLQRYYSGGYYGATPYDIVLAENPGLLAGYLDGMARVVLRRRCGIPVVYGAHPKEASYDEILRLLADRAYVEQPHARAPVRESLLRVLESNPLDSRFEEGFRALLESDPLEGDLIALCVANGGVLARSSLVARLSARDPNTREHVARVLQQYPDFFSEEELKRVR